MKRHITPLVPVLIRKRDWLALPEHCRSTGIHKDEILVMSGGRMVPAQIIE